MRFPAQFVAVASLCGCFHELTDSSDVDLQITPSSNIVAPGTTQNIVLWNRSSAMLSENLCPVIVQRRQGGTWDEAFGYLPPGAACPDYARRFPPGGIIQRAIDIPSTAHAGDYRVVFLGLRLESGEQLPEDVRASDPFIVQP